jgi:ribonuclease HI
MIVAYTDGSCLGNPGKGGWCVILLVDGKEVVLSGGEKESTNNRMELLAALVAIEKTNELNMTETEQLTIYSDSKYVCDGITTWLKNWKKNMWKTKGNDVKNQDLWKNLDKSIGKRTIYCKWVKAHGTNEMNNRVDVIARSEASKI